MDNESSCEDVGIVIPAGSSSELLNGTDTSVGGGHEVDTHP